jgi:hypothetical protein
MKNDNNVFLNTNSVNTMAPGTYYLPNVTDKSFENRGIWESTEVYPRLELMENGMLFVYDWDLTPGPIVFTINKLFGKYDSDWVAKANKDGSKLRFRWWYLIMQVIIIFCMLTIGLMFMTVGIGGFLNSNIERNLIITMILFSPVAFATAFMFARRFWVIAHAVKLFGQNKCIKR